MIELIIWLGALLCTDPNHTCDNHGSCNLVHINTASTSSTTGNTGGETGGNPKPPPPPPHP